MSEFWRNYSTIKKDLDKVTEIMKENSKSKEKTIEEALLELINSRGKMLRPGFLLLSGRFGEYDSEKLCSLAAVIEMLHMATLVHDDILDNALLRRGQETVQHKYGKNYAVFIGDFLFTQCFMTLSDKTSIENMKIISKIIARICAGEIEQFSSQFKVEVSVKKYLKRIASKTAALFSLSSYIGAVESSCSEELSRNLGRTGYYIGMAFQIIDDIIDFNGSEKVAGKPVGSDLRQGIYTLPVIYALMNDDGKLKKLLQKNTYNCEEIMKIIEEVQASDGIDKSKLLARKYTDKAFKQISNLPNIEARDILIDITNKLLVRQY